MASIPITDGDNTVYPFKSGGTSEGSALTSATEVAAALAKYSSLSGIADAFATAINSYLVTTATISNFSASEEATSDGTYTYSATATDPGYYLIVDTTENLNSDDAYTDYIVEVVGNVQVAVKSSVPTVTKTVTDTSGDESNATSASVGDTVSFTLTATMPSTYANYSTYALKFNDKLSTNLTYSTDSVAVTVNNYTACENLYSFEDSTNYYTLTDGVYTKVDTTVTTTPEENTTYYTCVSTVVASSNGGYTVTTPEEGDYNLVITIADTNKLTAASNGTNYIDVDSSTTIVVTYTATVTSGIAAGTAETNKVVLEYSNNPNASGTGKTTEEKISVYTFDLEVSKTDGDGKAEDETLQEAGFTLYKLDSSVNSETNFEGSTKYYTISGTSATIAGSYTADTDYYVVAANADTVGEDYKLTFNNLGEGTYALVESTTPTGYNTAAAVIFVIEATYGDSGSITALTVKDTERNTISGDNGTFSTTYSSGTISTTVKNVSGSSLPTTGGVGTTIFYVVGAVLVLGAGVVLITRRRMASK